MNLKEWYPWYSVVPLDHKQCMPYLHWVINGEKDSITGHTFNFLLTHCYDGVVWGRLNSDNAWRLSSQVFKGVGPDISESNLLEIRLFGNEQEILIWNTDQGFLGRLLCDKPDANSEEHFQPDDETRILLGDKYLDAQEGFTLVGTARGLQQAVPLECTREDFSDHRLPFRLKLRHYFEQDKCTGVVRVAASRLKNVKKL